MDSKCGDDKDAKGSDIVNAAGPTKSLVSKFAEFAFDVLKSPTMDTFFEDNIEAFDQDEEDLHSGRGETLEQYEIYQKYVNELEVHFDLFAVQEGYESATDCFKDINDAVIGDATLRKKTMKELSARIKEAHENWQKQFNKDAAAAIEDSEKAEGKDDDAKGSPHDEDDGKRSRDSKNGNESSRSSTSVADCKSEGKDGNGEKGEGKDSAIEEAAGSPPPPVMMFFQPISLDSMLQHVLSLTEYKTFSHIMRSKVRQFQLLKILRDKVDLQFSDCKGRATQLEAKSNLNELFVELVDRICGLTPHQKTYQSQIRRTLDATEWAALLAAGMWGIQ
jgi:hypothetical protein